MRPWLLLHPLSALPRITTHRVGAKCFPPQPCSSHHSSRFAPHTRPHHPAAPTDGDMDIGEAQSPSQAQAQGTAPVGGPATTTSTSKDPAVAALEQGVVRALRTNRALVLCAPCDAACGLRNEGLGSSLDPLVRMRDK